MLERLVTRAEPDQRRDMISRTITLRADTLDEAERSVEAVMSTEGKVPVFDWNRWGMIDEVLLSRGAELPDQIPLLETHQRYSIDDVLGSVRRMRIDGDETIGRLFFARDDQRVDRSWNKVRQGHVDSVSVGYRSIEFTDIEPNTTKTVAGRQYTAGSRPLRITTRWQAKELSLVPIGADPGAKIREELPPPQKEKPVNPKLRKYLEAIGLRTEATDEQIRAFVDAMGGTQRQIADVLTIEPGDDATRHLQRLSLEGLGVNADEPWKPLERQEMPPATPPVVPETRTEPTAPVDEAAIRKQAVADERTRVEMIRRVVGKDGDDEFIQRAISEGWNEERTATEVLKQMRENRAPAVGGVHSRSQETDTNVRSLAAGMLIDQGMDPTKHVMFREAGLPAPRDRFTEQDADLGHNLRGMSLPDLYRECLTLDTGRRYRTLDEAFIAVRSAGTSGGTLSYIFGTNVYARLIQGWDTVSDTTQGWCDEEDVANFLEQEDITFDGQARMDRLPRGDTAKHATVSDTHETYKIARYAKQFVMDEQDIIDDRFGALMKMPQELGEAARRVRPDFVYSLMLENPSLVADSTAVFHSDHNNLDTGALSEANLKVALQAMGEQRDGEGNVINVVPTHLITVPDLQWTARELTKSQTLIKLFADSSEPFYSQHNQLADIGLTPVMDARLNATGVVDPRTKETRTGLATNWFLVLANSRAIRVAYRRGTGRLPVMRSFVLDRGQWGLGWDINLDIGAAFMDYRGWYKSTGAG